MSEPRRVFITAAEVSGDQHAAQLVRSLKELDPTMIIEGLGGPLMRAAGCVVHRELVRHAAMGFSGALRLFEVRRLLRWAKQHFAKHRPNVQIGVDSPDMNIHFARLAKRMDVPVMQYVAPQLWGWREWRIKKFRKFVDHIACVLPFEEAYFRGQGMQATFIGHPLFDALAPASDRLAHLNGHAPVADRFARRPPTIGLLTGSRVNEARQNFPPLLEVAKQIAAAFPGTRFLMPTTAATEPVVAAAVNVLANATHRVGAFDSMVPQCDLCLTVSGTATLHVAGYGVPMIVVFRGSKFLWETVGKRLIKARTYALVNLMNDSAVARGRDALAITRSSSNHIVPEVVPWFGETERVAGLALDYLHHPAKLDAQADRLHELIGKLDHPGASMNVARLALSMMR